MNRSYVFGPYVLDPARRILLRGDTQVALTARAFDLLLALVERAGSTVDKDVLLKVVWPDAVVEEANLSQQIFTIRRHLCHSTDEPYIVTVPRRGYRFVAAVETHVSSPAEPPAGAAGPGGVRARLAIPLEDIRPVIGPTGVVVVSPDGRRIVFAGRRQGAQQLYLRSIDSFDVIPIQGTEEASHPVFSPDGAWVAFQAKRRLQKVWLGGGPPVQLCEVADVRGISWSRRGVLVFAPGPTTGLWRVDDAGGAAEPLTVVDFEEGERTHRWPHVLPDGSGVLFTVGRAGAVSFDDANLAYAPMAGTGHRILMPHATDGRLLTGGLLAWARGGCILTASFDAAAVAITSAPRLAQAGVAVSATGVAHMTCADNGTCVYLPGDAETIRRSLVVLDRAGRVQHVAATGDALEEPRVAPDGRTALVSLRGRTSDIWLCDLHRPGLTRLTFEGENFAGIFGPGAGILTFSSSRNGGASDLYAAPIDQRAPAELLVASAYDKAAGAWTADGRRLVFTEYHPETGADLWLLERDADRAHPLVRTRFNEYTPALSPDERCLAFATDESGRPEIQLVSFPEGTGKRQVSTDGGCEPAWSPDGRELFYRSGDRMMRIDMSRGVDDAGIPTTLFEGRYVAGSVTLANYDTDPGTGHFIMVRAEAAPLPTHLRVVFGWPAGESVG